MSTQLDHLLPALSRSEIEIDQSDFEEWLDARRSSVVGTSCEDDTCPISNYLTEQYHERYYVGAETCGTSDVPAHYQLPSWVKAFVNRLDYAHSYQSYPITGAAALESYTWAVAHAQSPFDLLDDEFAR